MKPTPEMIEAAREAYTNTAGTRRGIEAALTAALALVEPGEPVAFRIKDIADGWILRGHMSALERKVYADAGHHIEPLYASPPPPAQADDDWQLVPKKATAEMCSKGADAFFSPMPETIEDENARAASVYRRMLAASPPPPAQADDGKDAEPSEVDKWITKWADADAALTRANALIRELVTALKSIDSEMDDTDHKFATRMFKAGEMIEAILARAKEAGYE